MYPEKSTYHATAMCHFEAESGSGVTIPTDVGVLLEYYEKGNTLSLLVRISGFGAGTCSAFEESYSKETLTRIGEFVDKVTGIQIKGLQLNYPSLLSDEKAAELKGRVKGALDECVDELLAKAHGAIDIK